MVVSRPEKIGILMIRLLFKKHLLWNLPRTFARLFLFGNECSKDFMDLPSSDCKINSGLLVIRFYANPIFVPAISTMKVYAEHQLDKKTRGLF